MKILATVPVVNRPDLLEDCLASLNPALTDGRLIGLTILDNSAEGFAAWSLHGTIRPIVPLSFAQSQNAFQTIARQQDADAILFAHSDMKCTPAALDRIITAAEHAPPGWGVIFTHYDVLCIYSREAIEKAGPWDTQIPWYHADEDWYRRVGLAGLRIVEAGGDGITHQNGASNTIKADWRLHMATDAESYLSSFVYREKWGGDPHREKFDVPYDGMRLAPPVQALVSDTLARRLAGLIETDQGTLFERQQDVQISAQTRAIAWAYERAGRPTNILETGTCKGFFGCLMNWLAPEETRLRTYDDDPRCLAVFEALREGTRLKIIGTIGDSRQTLKGEDIEGFGLAWLDGGHSFEVAFHDIATCMAAGVPWILIDDSDVPNVRAAIEKAGPGSGYSEISHPWKAQDARKIAVLVRK